MYSYVHRDRKYENNCSASQKLLRCDKIFVAGCHNSCRYRRNLPACGFSGNSPIFTCQPLLICKALHSECESHWSNSNRQDCPQPGKLWHTSNFHWVIENMYDRFPLSRYIPVQVPRSFGWWCAHVLPSLQQVRCGALPHSRQIGKMVMTGWAQTCLTAVQTAVQLTILILF